MMGLSGDGRDNEKRLHGWEVKRGKGVWYVDGKWESKKRERGENKA